MSIANEIRRINDNIASAYTVCEERYAQMPALQNSSNLAGTIESIPQNIGEKLVSFFDYDGTLLYSYDIAEINALSSLPALPEHTGLTAAGWNWTLSQIKEYVNTYRARVNVGAFYRTSDGKTRIYITLERPDPALGNGQAEFDLCLYQTALHVVEVDWGDGTPAQTFGTEERYMYYNGRQMYRRIHSYAPSEYPASYTVTLTKLGEGGYGFGTRAISISSDSAVRRIELSGSETISSSAFRDQCRLETIAWGGYSCENMFAYCESLKFVSLNGTSSCICLCCSSIENVSLPAGCQRISDQAFYDCSSLKSVGALPSCVSVGASAFNGCLSLRSAELPLCTAIGAYAFYNCVSLAKVSLPLCSSIGAYAFRQCQTLKSPGIVSQCSTMGSGAFKGAWLFDKAIFSASIPENAFNENYAIKSIRIPSGVTQIASGAFTDCHSLIEVDLTAFTDPADLPVLGAGFASVFTCSASFNTHRNVVYYVASEEMKTAFSNATNWSGGADYYVVQQPQTA